MPVRTLFFRRLLPDRSVFDPEASHKAENVLPIAGTYRPISQLQTIGSLVVSGTAVEQPILSAYAHVYQPSAPIQRIQPDERTGTTNWMLHDRSTVDADADESQEEVEANHVGTENFDDGLYLISPGAATTELVEFTVEVVQAPPATASSHHLFIRYKIIDPDDTNAWTVKARVKAAAGTIATFTATGTGELDWTTGIVTLSAGEMANLVANDFTVEDQMTLEIEGTVAGSNQVVDPDGVVQNAGWLDENAEVDDIHESLIDADDATYVDSPALAPAFGEAPLRFSMADITEPAGFSNLAIILKWKSSNSGIKANFFAYSGGVLFARLEDVVPPTSLTSETKALTVEDDVEFSDIDWADVNVTVSPRYEIDFASEEWATFFPAADVDVGSWTTAPLFSKINDTDDGTFIQSPSMAANVDEAFEIDLDQTPDVAADQSREREIVIRCRHDAASGKGVEVRIIEDSVVVASTTLWVTTGASFADRTWKIDNYEEPNEDISSSGWSTAPLWSKIDDDTNTITSGGTAGDNFIVGVTSPTDPSNFTGWGCRLTAWVSAGGTAENLQVSLYEGTTLIETSEVLAIDDTETVYFVEFSEAQTGNVTDFDALRLKVNVVGAGTTVTVRRVRFEAPSAYPDITDYEGMRVRVTAVGSSETGWQMDIAEAYMQIAAHRRVQVTELDVQTDPTSWVGASWLQFQVPEASSGSYVAESDKLALVAGRLKRIYLVDPQATSGLDFTDISQGATDLAAGAYPWDFATWGEEVLATNKVEEAQKFNPDSDSATSDLITSTDKPKGRFGDVCRNQYVLANISFAGTPAGFADEIWGSAQDDAANFDDAGLLGQFRQRIWQVPGEITGFLGGNFMVIWKRSGMVRGDWIGSPNWWDLDNIISHETGTGQPGSIVRVGQEIFFYGSDGRFYKTTGFEEPTPIDDGFHYSMLPPAGDNLISRVSSNFPSELQNRVFGAYDRGTKCVIWAARSLSDSAYKNTKLFVYNVVERRFSTATLNEDKFSPSTFGASALAQLPNTENDSVYKMYGLGIFMHTDLLNRYETFSGPDETVTVRSPVYPMDAEKDGVGTIHRVRPFYRTESRITRLVRGHFSVVIYTWDDRVSEENARVETLSGADSNEGGWIECSLKGRFVQAEIVISRQIDRPPLGFGVVLELLGVQIDMEALER